MVSLQIQLCKMTNLYFCKQTGSFSFFSCHRRKIFTYFLFRLSNVKSDLHTESFYFHASEANWNRDIREVKVTFRSQAKWPLTYVVVHIQLFWCSSKICSAIFWIKIIRHLLHSFASLCDKNYRKKITFCRKRKCGIALSYSAYREKLLFMSSYLIWPRFAPLIVSITDR